MTPLRVWVCWFWEPASRVRAGRWHPVGDAYATKRLMNENIRRLAKGTVVRWTTYRLDAPKAAGKFLAVKEVVA